MEFWSFLCCGAKQAIGTNNGVVEISFWVFISKTWFFVQFWTKNVASSRTGSCGSGLLVEWPFRSQNTVEALESPLPSGLWVKPLITHALSSLAYSDIAWYKAFLILIMKGLYCVFFVEKKHHIVYWLISPSISNKLTLEWLADIPGPNFQMHQIFISFVIKIPW